MGWIFCLIVIIIIICGWIQPYRTATHNYFFLRNRLSVRQLENNNIIIRTRKIIIILLLYKILVMINILWVCFRCDLFFYVMIMRKRQDEVDFLFFNTVRYGTVRSFSAKNYYFTTVLVSIEFTDIKFTCLFSTYGLTYI